MYCIPILLGGITLGATAQDISASATPTQPVSAPSAAEHDPYVPSSVELLREEAARVLRTVKTSGAKRWLVATNWLPIHDPRTVYVNKEKRTALGASAWSSLAESERETYEARPLEEKYFYYTRYGSPLAYARALDLACEHWGGGPSCFASKRILDYGYGGIGHLRLLASLGAHATGVDIDPILAALYSQSGDTGEVPGVGMGGDIAPNGSLTLLHGRWPGEPVVREAAGGDYDLILSKNTLKKGYIHPAQEVDKRMLVDLGVDDAAFLDAVAGALKPGGLFIIYNICPKQNPEKYIPWADGHCPFDRALMESAGMEIIEFDKEDSPATRTLGRALGWDRGDHPMDIENDTFAWVTIARKK